MRFQHHSSQAVYEVSFVLSNSKKAFWTEIQNAIKKESSEFEKFRTPLLRILDRMCYRTSAFQGLSSIALPQCQKEEQKTYRALQSYFDESEQASITNTIFIRNPTFWTDGKNIFLWSFRPTSRREEKRASYSQKCFRSDLFTASILARLGSRSWSYQELSAYLRKLRVPGPEIPQLIQNFLDNEFLLRDLAYYPVSRDPEKEKVSINGHDLLLESPADPEQSFVQSIRPFEQIDHVPTAEVNEACSLIETLNFLEYDKWRPIWLEKLKEEFSLQFPENHAPLLEVVNKLDLGQRPKQIDYSIQEELEKYLHRIIDEAGGRMEEEIELTPEFVQELKRILKKFRVTRESSWSYMALVMRDKEKGFWPKLILSGGANRLLGHYALFDEKVRQDVKDRWEREKILCSPALMAEILNRVDVPANDYTHRVSFADYEIPIQGNSRLPEESQIRLEDLRVSLIGNRFVVHSERLGRQIIPVATHKIVWAVAHPVEKFLLTIGHQNQLAGMSWGWERMIRREYYPRLRYKGIVLSPRKWTVGSAWLRKHVDDPELTEKVTKVLGIPESVLHLDHDRVTSIRFSSVASREVLKKLMRKYETLVFTEHFGTDSHEYVKELMIPIDGKAPSVVSPEEIRRARELKPEPVSSVMSFHLSLDQRWYSHVLTEVLPEVVKNAQGRFGIQDWFYILYTSEGPEIRLRFLGVHHNGIGTVIDWIQQEFQSRLPGILRDIKLVAYQRSLRHYGSLAGNIAYEKLSALDSEASLEFHKLKYTANEKLNVLGNNVSLKLEREILWILLSAQAYLENFSTVLSTEGKARIFQGRMNYWKDSADAGNDFSDIHRYFRENRHQLLKLLFDKNHDGNDFLKQAITILEERSRRSEDIINTILQDSQIDFPHYVFRLIHMHKVRISLNVNLEVEALILYLLGELHRQNAFKESQNSKSKS